MKTYLKTILVLLAGGVFLTNCGPDDYVQRNCDKFFPINLAVDTLYFFDYDNSDTIKYKRIIDNVVQDTLVFVIKERRKDSLAIDRNEASTNEECISTVNYFEQWFHLYEDATTGLTYSVQLIGTDTFWFSSGGTFLTRVNKRIIYGRFGSNSIGDKNCCGYTYEYATSEGTFVNNWTWSWTYWRGPILSGGNFDHREENSDYSTNSIYNPNYGRIQISFNDEQEIWDLIP
jgi:hypothetical protein